MKFKKNASKNKRVKGFTLLELLIAMSIFLIGIAAVYGALRMATIQRNTVNTRTDQMRSARIALEYIRRDAVNAGFGYHRTGGNMPDNAGNGLFGLPSDADTFRDLMTSVIAGNDISNNNLNFGGKMDVVAFISRDATFNGGALVNYTGSAVSGSAVNITTAANGAQTCRQYDLYLLESALGTTQVIGMASSIPDTNTIQFAVGGTNNPLNLNQSATATGDNQSLLATTAGGGTIKQINLISYSITADGVLVRKKFGNRTGLTATDQIESRELVYGVSDFQVRYFMEDGTTIDDPSNGNDGRTNQIKLNSVVQIQVSITMMADSSDGQQKTNTPMTIKEYISTKNLRYEAS